MLKRIEQFDAGVARGEAALATVFLLSMILAASVQAVVRNLSGMEVEFATNSLESLTWVDPFLQKGTLWLAFLGASLATREGRHIGIDLFPRIAPKKTKLLLRAIAGFGSAIVSFYLARAFWAAVLVNADERPSEFEVWGDSGALHVCDATAAQVADASLEVPNVLCAIRGALGSIGVPIETGQAALQLIVPVMFFFIAVRLFGGAVGASYRLATGQLGPDTPEPKGADDAPAANKLDNVAADSDEEEAAEETSSSNSSNAEEEE